MLNVLNYFTAILYFLLLVCNKFDQGVKIYINIIVTLFTDDKTSRIEYISNFLEFLLIINQMNTINMIFQSGF